MMLSPEKSQSFQSSAPYSHRVAVYDYLSATTPDQPALVHLNWDRLTPFEPVQDQYQDLGLQFEGAIALCPSNPAFRDRQSELVLMPKAAQSSFVIHVRRPVSWISIRAIAVRQLTLTAANRQHQILMQRRSNSRRFLNTPDDLTQPLPEQTLEVSGHGITQIRIDSDDPFVVTELVVQ